MDLWQLKVFCKVIEHKSFSKAGEAVHLSQPTVSSHIKELESHFGTQLIDRLARQAEPTKAGDLLYRHAQRLIALHSETEAAMAEFLGKNKGTLSIGGSTIPGGYLLPRQIGAFARRYPGIRVALMVGDTSEILAEIISGRLEFGIVGAQSDDAYLSQISLAQDDLRLIVPADHKWAQRSSVSIPELIDEPFIAREKGSGTLRSIEKNLHRIGYSLERFQVVAEMGSTEAVRQGIKSHVGLSILSAIAVAEDVQLGLLKALQIEDLELKRNFLLTRHRSRTLSPICRLFIEFLAAQFGHTDDDFRNFLI